MKALNNSQPVRRCKHISAKGSVCHRLAMRSSSLCSVHLDDPDLSNDDCKTDFQLPAIEDPASIQVAENQVLSAVCAGEITPSHASLYMYGLQIARQNAKALQKVEKRKA
jgi:hypothetical protein